MPKTQRSELEDFLYGKDTLRRYTQDSPVLPDVWLAYGAPAGDSEDEKEIKKELAAVSSKGVDLLLRPYAPSSASALHEELENRLAPPRSETRLAYNQAYVAVHLRFEDLIRTVLPLSPWWQEHLLPGEKVTRLDRVLADHRREIIARLASKVREQGRRYRENDILTGNLVWFVGIVGRIALRLDGRSDSEGDAAARFEKTMEIVKGVDVNRLPCVLWAVNRNRTIQTSLWRSRCAIKADAATLLFNLSCTNLRWAVIDSGIDARHPAFQQRPHINAPLQESKDGTRKVDSRTSRVIATYDFTELRKAMAEVRDPAGAEGETELEGPTLAELADPKTARGSKQEFARRVTRGLPLDWDLLQDRLKVPHDRRYKPPKKEHGTHVAGTIGGNWLQADPTSATDHDVRGICPDIELYDLRVFNDAGEGEEFAILSALQFVRHLNAQSDLQQVHGVNLSLSIKHDVANYACGRTPVCDEAERVVAAGIVVVAAAGNDGRARYQSERGEIQEGYRSISITDPGNAEEVITVGATHRDEPHTYGVSYFSSRGPTGDGRPKPDLVAPGEKINAPVPDAGLRALDGTSMAAPHVSGAAALLLARHPELIGRPREVKRTLCESATDLGREHFFQGHGMVDVLRALQAV